MASAVDTRKHISNEELLAVFSHFDTQGQGRITSTDLLNVFSRSGQDVSRPEVRAMLDEAVRESRNLDFEQFKLMMRQSASYLLPNIRVSKREEDESNVKYQEPEPELASETT